MSPAKSLTLLILVVLMTLLTPAPPAGAELRGTYTFTLTEGGATSGMTCFSRQDGSNVAVTCESSATAGTCGLTVTTLRGEVKKGGKTVSLTGTTPVRNADCSVQGIECMKMTLTMNGSAAAAGYGFRRFCTAGADSSFTVAASRTSLITVDRNQDLDRNGTPELLWEDVFVAKFYAWYMDGKNVLRKKDIYSSSYRGRFVAAADFNSDGKPDLLMQDVTKGGVSIVMQKNGAFRSENRVTAMNHEGHWKVVGAGDFDGDGYPDIVVQYIDTGKLFVFYWDGSHFVNGRQIGTVDDKAWRAVGVGDFDFDNRPDILLHNEVTGAVAVWHINESNVTAISSIGIADPVWHAHAVYDMNADGHPDIIWRNHSTGGVAIWYMDRTHHVLSEIITTVSDHNLQLAGGLAYASCPGFSQYSQILWRNQSTGWVAVWVMSGTTFESVSYIPDTQAIPSLKDLNWRIVATGDLNSDYWEDILWQNEVTGRIAVWYMWADAVLFSQELPPVADTSWKIVGTGDFDGDGYKDILLHRPATGGLRLLLMNGTSIVRQVSLGGVAKGWRVGGVGSFYPGKMDIYFQEIATGRIAVWHMDGTNRVSSRAVATPGDKDWVLVGLRQFSGDLTRDLLVQNQETGEAAVWLMSTSEAVWAVRSIGTAADLNWKVVGVYR
jgi:hypothetical protein